MAKSLNYCILVGNTGRDPEIRTVGDTQVAQFSLATSTGGFKKQDGTDIPEKTQWHTIVAWRGLAELCKYIHKGDQVTVIGEITYREYTDNNNQRRYVTDITARDIILPRKNSEGGYRPQLTPNDIPSLEAIRSAMPPRPEPTAAVIDVKEFDKSNFGGPAEMNIPRPTPQTIDFKDDLPF